MENLWITLWKTCGKLSVTLQFFSEFFKVSEKNLSEKRRAKQWQDLFFFVFPPFSGGCPQKRKIASQTPLRGVAFGSHLDGFFRLLYFFNIYILLLLLVEAVFFETLKNPEKNCGKLVENYVENLWITCG